MYEENKKKRKEEEKQTDGALKTEKQQETGETNKEEV